MGPSVLRSGARANEEPAAAAVAQIKTTVAEATVAGQGAAVAAVCRRSSISQRAYRVEWAMLLKPNVEMQMRSSRFQVFGAAWVAVQLAGLLVSGGAWAQGAAAPAAPVEAASKPAAAATKPAAGKPADGKAAAVAPGTAKAAAKPAATQSTGATAAAPRAPSAP